MVSISALQIFHFEMLFLYEYLCTCMLLDLVLLSHSLIQSLSTLSKTLSNIMGCLFFRSHSHREKYVWICFGRASNDLFFCFYRYRFTSPSRRNVLWPWSKRWWDFWSSVLGDWVRFTVLKGLWENPVSCLDKHFNYCRAVLFQRKTIIKYSLHPKLVAVL